MNNELNSIFSNNSLLIAWHRVKGKGAGGGVDGISLSEYEANLGDNLTQLLEEVHTNLYIPEPYLRFFLKKSSGSYRPISALTIKDKIVQHAVVNFYDEKLNKLFVDSNYAYRKNKGHTKAINRIQDYIARGYSFVSTMDIDNFFDTINRAKLFEKCKIHFENNYVQKLIEMWIMTGVVSSQKYIESELGIAQGGIISPILSNLYLHDFDVALNQNNIPNIRYADNIILITKTADQAISASNFTESFLQENLQLKLNSSPSIKSVKEGFTFCGVHFFEKMRRIAPDKFESMKANIRNIVAKHNTEKLPGSLNDHLQGLERYYSTLNAQDQILLLEDLLITELKKRFQNEANLKYAEKKILLNKINFISNSNKINKNKIIASILAREPQQQTSGNSFASVESRRGVYNKKRKYQKLWYEDLDLLVSTKFSVIGKSADSITIRRDGKIINQILIKKIKNIIVSARGCSISTDAIELCSNARIRIDFFDSLGKPYATLIPAAAPIQSIMAEQFDALNTDKSKHIIKTLISAKIKNQVSVIKYFIKNKKEFKTLFSDQLNRIEDLLVSIDGLSHNLSLDDFRAKILGYEGSAAVDYWNMLKKLLPDKYEFENREHKAADNLINMMLNYGYGILYNRILTSITVAGLNPNISYLHKEQKGKPTLVFDLIETFRAPAVDRTIIAIATKHANLKTDKNLIEAGTKTILSKKLLLRMNTEFTHRGNTTSINKLIIEQAEDLVKFLQGKTEKFKPYISKW